MPHDTLVDRLITAWADLTPRRVGDAFLASLSTRRLDWRSALGSYGFALNFPRRAISDSPRDSAPSGAEWCRVCGTYSFDPPRTEDVNVLNFERHKWGGVRHTDPLYAWFDLCRFAELSPPTPTAEDHRILREILKRASDQDPKARASALQASLTGVFKSNKSERTALIEILSIAGVLQPRDDGGFFTEFTAEKDRRRPPDHTNDWGYPAIIWRGSDGVDADAVRAFFPNL